MTTVAPPSGATRDTHQENPDCPGVHRHYLVTMAEMLRATVAALLEQEPGTALCDACLSFACSTTLIEARRITESLVAQGPNFSERRRVRVAGERCRPPSVESPRSASTAARPWAIITPACSSTVRRSTCTV